MARGTLKGHETRCRSDPSAQLALFAPPKQRGGKRRGAGRKPKCRRAGSPHKTRPELKSRYPVHVTLRVVAAVGNLRRRCAYDAIREATITTARREVRATIAAENDRGERNARRRSRTVAD